MDIRLFVLTGFFTESTKKEKSTTEVAFYFRCTLSLQQGKWNPQIFDAHCRGGLEIPVIWTAIVCLKEKNVLIFLLKVEYADLLRLYGAT